MSCSALSNFPRRSLYYIRTDSGCGDAEVLHHFRVKVWREVACRNLHVGQGLRTELEVFARGCMLRSWAYKNCYACQRCQCVERGGQKEISAWTLLKHDVGFLHHQVFVLRYRYFLLSRYLQLSPKQEGYCPVYWKWGQQERERKRE